MCTASPAECCPVADGPSPRSLTAYHHKLMDMGDSEASGNGTCCAEWVMCNLGRHSVLSAICCPFWVDVKVHFAPFLGDIFQKSWHLQEQLVLLSYLLVFTGEKASSTITVQTYHPLWEAGQFPSLQ